MLITFKITLLAIVFVLSSGSLFSEYFRKHKKLSVLAAIIAILSSFYLMKGIYNDFKVEVGNEIRGNLKQENTENLNYPNINITEKSSEVITDQNNSNNKYKNNMKTTQQICDGSLEMSLDCNL